MHLPVEHETPAAQAEPHEPQLAASDCVLTQTPLQSLWLDVHGVGTTHAPLLQVSPGEASALPQDVPSGAAGFEQAPVSGLQVPARWHESDAVQVTGLLPVHVPFWQESLRVHAFPSLHAVPLGAAGFEQLPLVGSHVPGL